MVSYFYKRLIRLSKSQYVSGIFNTYTDGVMYLVWDALSIRPHNYLHNGRDMFGVTLFLE